MKTNRIPTLVMILAVAVWLCPATLRAQWQNQTIVLKPGWNAVYLHVDPSHITLDSLVVGAGNPITEVWMWQPAVSTVQFVTTPQQPTTANSQWLVWDRSVAVSDTLPRLLGNAAYLVRNNSAANYSWVLTGKPVPPNYRWSTAGLNLIGFPTMSDDMTFEDFFTFAPELRHVAEVYRYPGGEAAGAEPTPARVLPPMFRNVFVKRGEAFWIRAGDHYNRYYGPIEVSLQNPSGIAFGTSLGTYSLRIKNLTPANRTINFRVLASDAPPVGQQAIAGTPPLLVRGALNTSTLTYDHSVLALNTPFNVTLAPAGQPGSEQEVVIGLNRSAMNTAAGTFWAGIIRFDLVGFTQLFVPVTATVPDSSGLWVGSASVLRVGQYLKSYARDAQGLPVLGPVTASGAGYVVTGINSSMTSVPRAFPLRIILHNKSSSGEASLLQRVFYGTRLGTNAVVSKESLLDAGSIATARRISAPHLPFSLNNTVWPKTSGTFGIGGSMEFNVPLTQNDHAANPFLHTFHPDHDNLDVDFATVLPQGKESYRVDRRITLSFTPPGTDFASLTASRQTIGGNYAEQITITGATPRQFNIDGVFSLNLVSPVPTLITQ